MTATGATGNPPGLWRDEHHRYFYGDRGPMPSVTTIVGVVDKSGPLVGWAKRETAACAIRNIDMLNTMVATGGRDAAEAWLSKIPDHQRDASADMGTRVHDLVRAIIAGEPINPTGVEVPYVRAWRRFADYIRPTVTHSEVMVANLAEWYGGTFDLGVLIDGVPTLLDIKTGNVYVETALQLAGYAGAEFAATPDDPTPVALPRWERFGVVHLQPDDWSLIPFDVTPDTIATFNAANKLHRWTKGDAPWSKGRPVKEPPIPA